jgi:hypothetical protein
MSNLLVRGEHFPSSAHKILVYYDKLHCDPNSINDGDIVYCDTHQINQFKNFLKQKRNLTIITHNSDGYVCDGSPWKKDGVNTNDFDGCYTKWYAQNSYSLKDNVIPIPIGFENTKWEKVFGPKTLQLNEIILEDIQPDKVVYFNCNILTNTKERSYCLDVCKNLGFVDICQNRLAYKEYLRDIKCHKFTISPEGNGLDCHRTWETLAMGRIPILINKGSFKRLYKDLPVLFIQNWEDIGKIDLDCEFDKLRTTKTDFLNMDYWRLYE